MAANRCEMTLLGGEPGHFGRVTADSSLTAGGVGTAGEEPSKVRVADSATAKSACAVRQVFSGDTTDIRNSFPRCDQRDSRVD